MFRSVGSKVSFPRVEGEILRFWKEKDIFVRSVEGRRGGRLFVLYEGPPTANASPGVHHVLARVFKDLFPRYKTMKGYSCPRKGGWDTHGLPVELEVERELGLGSKPEIEAYGVAEFNRRCRESVFRYVEDWKDLTERIGFWIDMEGAYVTCEKDYIESCWWIIKRLREKGLIYRDYKVTPHCPRCETSLSSHEVALGYKDDVDDPSIYIGFKLTPASRKTLSSKLGLEEGKVDTSLLAWTTTPWTLLGNTALAVAKEAEYALVELKGSAGEERLILAMALLKSALKDEYRVVAVLKGEDLVGLMYESLYDLADDGKYPGFPYIMKFRQGVVKPVFKWEIWGTLDQYKVVAGDFVSMSEGTGIVHIAPAYGEVDMELGRKEELWFLHPVRLNGRIDNTLKPFNGLFVKDADPLIIEDLRSRGLLYRSERIRHTYPFCWRCDTPLLYYAKDSWYIKTTAKKERLLSGNEEINWYPEYIKRGRFGDWLENNVDWSISRERYWGTPLPVWCCQGCGREEWVGSIEDLKGLAHEEAMEKEGHSLEECLKDLHRPYVDYILLQCPDCHQTMRRAPEVIDCWFDSGAMPVAQWHYPFENQETFSQFFPADYICEAVDQTRGWFYSLHALSILLFDRPCYKNVICLGHILDDKGEKMSKSRGNVAEPWAVLHAHGADALRWYLFTSSPPGNTRRFSLDLVGEVVRKFLLTLWNTYSFFVTYANIDKFDPRSGDAGYRSELDRWILSELHRLIAEVTRLLDGYDPTGAGRAIEDFVNSLSNWYVRRSRRRFWKSENDADKQAAYYTLYQCLVTLAKLLAPFTPFLAEEIYQNLVCSVDAQAPESVHLADFPTADPSKIDKQLSAATALAMKVSSLGRAARAKAGIKVRQPLARVLVKATKEEGEALARLAHQVLEEVNVKEMAFLEEDFLSQPGYAVAVEGGLMVGVLTEITPELAAEGLARELVHRLQMMRRSAGFDIADYIETYYQGAPSIERVMAAFADYIKQETLSRRLVASSPPEGAYAERHRLGEGEVLLGVKRL